MNSICPGGIATPIFGKGLGMPQDRAERLAVLAKIFLNEIQPIKRAGLPEDIAKAALWLASDDSNFVSGHALVVDGGLIWKRILDQDSEKLEEFAEKLGIESIDERMRQINEEIAKMK